jgi:polyisoprenoid-binding protein YceI
MACSASLRAAEKLKLDTDKSKISFVGSKPDNSSHEGGFKKFEVEAMADFENAGNSSLKIVIDTNSLWSDNPKLTGHLKNPDFFDVRKYPKAVFESKSIQAADDGTITFVGDLEMLGKTNEVKIPMKHEMSEDAVKLMGKFKIDRTRWGMNYGAPEGKINKEVEMDVVLVLKR